MTARTDVFDVPFLAAAIVAFAGIGPALLLRRRMHIPVTEVVGIGAADFE
ncbi:MAG: hypothetical protein WCP98_06095 [Actinomycetes bacterium]